jgi:hypothetical protein
MCSLYGLRVSMASSTCQRPTNSTSTSVEVGCTIWKQVFESSADPGLLAEFLTMMVLNGLVH